MGLIDFHAVNHAALQQLPALLRRWLTASVNEISQQVSRSATIASGAVEEAERSNAMVQGLAEAADKIGEVVNLINDIASRTNPNGAWHERAG